MIFQIVAFLFPWSIRRRLLQWRYGWVIHPTATLGKSIILAKHLKMEERSRIHNFVLCKRIDNLTMGVDSGIASFTYITGFSSDTIYFKHVVERKCELVLGRSAGITSRHFVDCNGGVYIGDFTTVAGIRSQILTHSIDIYKNRQDVKPVRIGKYCFVGSGCVILPGATLPDYCVLGGGSTLNKAYDKTCTIYAGTPAIPKKDLDLESVAYFHRQKHIVD